MPSTTRNLLEALGSAQKSALQGLTPPAEAWLWAAALREGVFPFLVRVTVDMKEARELCENVRFFAGEDRAGRVALFSPHDHLPYTGLLGGADTMADRMEVLQSLIRHTTGGQANRETAFLVLPWQAALTPTLPPKIFRAGCFALRKGESGEREELARRLEFHGYRRETVAESPGEFACRGGILDIFPPHYENPVRVELDGETVFSIRFFDAATQVSLKLVPGTDRGNSEIGEVFLFPAHEILLREDFLEGAAKKLKAFSDGQELPATLRREVLERWRRREFFAGVETFLPAFYDRPHFIFEYLPDDAVYILPDAEKRVAEGRRLAAEAAALHAASESLEKIIPPDAYFAAPETVQKMWEGKREIVVNPVFSLPEEVVRHAVTVRDSAALRGAWHPDRLREWKEGGLDVELVCHTPIQAERLHDLLKQAGAPETSVRVGSLSAGFLWEEAQKGVLTEEEIFGHKTARRLPPRQRSVPFAHFAQLREGDLLVHEDYGINRYRGLRHLVFGRTEGDFLHLEFAGEDRLYLPVYRMHLVQRYIGARTEGAPLDSLGGLRWSRVKQRARREIVKIAQELLKVHAQRTAHPGFGYPPPDTMDESFAARFPFDETPDQARAIEEVLSDMEIPRPMDRLICGDVGYGKTEVAMRAAFKSVNAGKQVALLVPTTVLALQHFETFLKRFEPHAVSVEMLTRFRSSAEQKKIARIIGEGKIDIVIGTHRLLARDVHWKNLGLLILDEEHRFGVRHKERIKKMKPAVDVLTLSATPIPRTLHMSLVGIKDLSLIHTPPVDRLAIRTFLARWDEALVRHAIQKELDRGGQVFFVHNRVATIEKMRRRLAEMFPAARVAAAHGQMDESELENVMVAFLHQKIDLLVTTAIIESGIDVPNANTMLINRADRFGLAQLYQLRGRVGRSDRQAFCYLLIPEEDLVSKEAFRRLEAMTRHTQLGAGFQIAQHDLEIRGAGNLLGTSQSGFVEEIGYELYTQLLEGAVRRLRGEAPEETIDPEIQLSVSAFIPEDYIPDPSLRMNFYKRMAHLGREEGVEALRGELRDRFGPLPEPADNLLAVIRIREAARRLRLRSVKDDGRHTVITWDPKTPVAPETIVGWVRNDPGRYQLKPNHVLLMRHETLPERERLETLYEWLKKVLSSIPD